MTTLADLITRIRNEFLNDWQGSDGPPLTYRWSSTNIANALNDAQREIARRTLYIADASSSVCSFVLAADINGNYPQSVVYSPKILRIRYVLFSSYEPTSRPHEITRTTSDVLNQTEDHRWSWIGRKGHVE